MLEGPKTPEQSEFQEVVSFLDDNLRPDQTWSIADEYPTAIHPLNSKNMQIIKHEEKIVSHALIRDLMIKSPAGLFKVATIGSVVTESTFRNQGLSKQTLEQLIDRAQGTACDFAVLWTDLYDFYRKFNFELAGAEISYTLNRPIPGGTENLKFIDDNKVSAQAILELYSKHTVTSMRNAAEIQKYLAIPEMRVHTAWDSSNKLRAYAIEGKGADLTGYIHEWGGSVPDLLSLFSHMQKTQNKVYTLIVPEHSQNLHRQLENFSFKPHRGFLGMFKILNPKGLFLKINNYARSIGQSDFILEMTSDNTFVVGRTGHTYETDSITDITQLIFGPHKDQLRNFDEDTRTTIKQVLPLPFWIWGWDSV